MQRLFATFPDGRSGIALLLLRFALAGVLILDGASLWPSPASTPLCFVLAGFMIVGICLPLFAFAGICGGIAASLVLGCGKVGEVAFIFAVFASTGLLGAGAYSVDGWLFGRRRVIITTSGKRNN